MVTGNLSIAIPRATQVGEMFRDPLGYLSRIQATHGNLFAIQEDSPMFCRSVKCAGSVVALGVESQRAVLTDSDSFGLPESAAIPLKLPKILELLNRSLHSMTGTEHRLQKRHLTDCLGVDPVHELVWRGIAHYDANRSRNSSVGLLREMRALALEVSQHVLFGKQYEEAADLATLLDTYFWLRREASSPLAAPSSELLTNLRFVGGLLDKSLRTYLRSATTPRAGYDGLLADFAVQSAAAGLSEDAIVGHSNILFISTTEPIASVLTWTLLALSQFKAIREDIRTELKKVCQCEIPTADEIRQLALIDQAVKESLRLLPPNAFMVRMTKRPTKLIGQKLPAGCEIVLCPLLAHRDSAIFHSPNAFDPSRWQQISPSPFAYFPFGAGQHACVGATLGIHLVKCILAFFLGRYEIVLTQDQVVDWRLNIQLLPKSDPQVSIRAINSRHSVGRLNGPVASLLGLSQE